jgi:hypothetical protein
MYGEQPVFRSQMDMKRKTCDIRNWTKHVFLFISPTNIDKNLSPLLYQRVETLSAEVFWLLSQPLPHLRFNLFVISETFATKVAISRPSCEPLYATNTSQHKQEIYLYKYPLHWVFLPTNKKHNRKLLFGNTLLKHGHHFDYETSLLTCSCASATYNVMKMDCAAT